MNLKRIAKAALALSLVSVWTWQHDLIGQAQKVQVPIFEYDPTFPKPLPENWAIGPIGGLAVDRQDHLYVLQRPAGLLTNERFSGADDNPPKADCCVPRIRSIDNRNRIPTAGMFIIPCTVEPSASVVV